MPPMQRRRHPSVMDALLAEPQRFKFFQAVRLLEQCFARQERGATRHTVPVHLRFPNAPGLGFPPSEIVDAVAYDKHGEVLVAIDDPLTRPARRLGLLGGSLHAFSR